MNTNPKPVRVRFSQDWDGHRVAAGASPRLYASVSEATGTKAGPRPLEAASGVRKAFHWAAQIGLAALIAGPAAIPLLAAPASEVFVVYNRKVPESKSIAEYYAQQRSVPAPQILGLDLPVGEEMSRRDFNNQLRDPLLKELTERKLLVFTSDDPSRQPPADTETRAAILPASAKVRYLLLSYGIPARILKDESQRDPNQEQLRAELQRNEAAVDNELALLPAVRNKLPITGPIANPVYGATNKALLHPTNGILLVARLDGPSADIARGLIDKSIEAEQFGLWGRAYFDARGITNGNYKVGDDWILGASKIAMRLGLETVVDSQPATFSAGFPMSHIAFYAGWYDGAVSGPFTRPQVEFMPGAIAYHLHSFSAATIRSAAKHWVGPLLAKGATATLGCVDEPYLEGTPNIAVLVERLLAQQFSFGEAAIASQPALSWQTTVIGDPLYTPFARHPREQHELLAGAKDARIEWSHLRVVNLNLATGLQLGSLIEYLAEVDRERQSAVLQEKLADLNLAAAKFSDSIEAFERALQLKPSPLQKVRLQLNYARALSLYQEKDKAFEVYKKFLEENPDFSERSTILERLAGLARLLNRVPEAERYEVEIKKLGGATEPAK